MLNSEKNLTSQYDEDEFMSIGDDGVPTTESDLVLTSSKPTTNSSIDSVSTSTLGLLLNGRYQTNIGCNDDDDDDIDKDQVDPDTYILLCSEVFPEMSFPPSPSPPLSLSNNVLLSRLKAMESFRTSKAIDGKVAHPSVSDTLQYPVQIPSIRYTNNRNNDSGKQGTSNDGIIGAGSDKNRAIRDKNRAIIRSLCNSGMETIGMASRRLARCATSPPPRLTTKKRELSPVSKTCTDSIIARKGVKDRVVQAVVVDKAMDVDSLPYPFKDNNNGNDNTSTYPSLSGDGDSTNNPSCATDISGNVAENALLHNSQYLAYSWDSLKLGQNVGSVALNNYLNRGGGGSRSNENNGRGCRSKLSPQQTLQIMNSLRPKTVLPPPGSELHDIIKLHYKTMTTTTAWEHTDVEFERESVSKTKIETEANHPSISSTTTDTKFHSSTLPAAIQPPKLQLPLDSIKNLCELLQAQDEDDGAAARRKTHHLTAAACIDTLKSIENTVCEYKLRHETLTREGEELGLLVGGVASKSV